MSSITEDEVMAVIARVERLGLYTIRDDTNGVYLFPKALFRRVRLRSVAPEGRTRDRA